MFDSGILLLVGAGKSEANARSMIGKWKRDHGSAEVISAISRAQREGTPDPIGLIEGYWRHRAGAEGWDSPC